MSEVYPTELPTYSLPSLNENRIPIPIFTGVNTSSTRHEKQLRIIAYYLRSIKVVLDYSYTTHEVDKPDRYRRLTYSTTSKNLSMTSDGKMDLPSRVLARKIMEGHEGSRLWKIFAMMFQNSAADKESPSNFLNRSKHIFSESNFTYLAAIISIHHN